MPRSIRRRNGTALQKFPHVVLNGYFFLSFSVKNTIMS